jgi:hypothetical protein
MTDDDASKKRIRTTKSGLDLFLVVTDLSNPDMTSIRMVHTRGVPKNPSSHYGFPIPYNVMTPGGHFRLTYHKRQIIDTTVVEPSRRQTATRIVLTMVHFPSSLDLLTLVLI